MGSGNRPAGLVPMIALAALALLLVHSAISATGIEISKSEIKNDIKVFLTKMRVRKVPLVKKKTEISLNKLFKEERELKELVATLEDEIAHFDRNQLNLRKSELLSKLTKEEISNPAKTQAKIKELTQMKLLDAEMSLKHRRAELLRIQEEIIEAKEIIKNPEFYIAIPHEFAENPEEYREDDRQQLIKDRENMLWRQQIAEGAIEPLWTTDKW